MVPRARKSLSAIPIPSAAVAGSRPMYSSSASRSRASTNLASLLFSPPLLPAIISCRHAHGNLTSYKHGKARRARFASHASAAQTLDCARHALDAIRVTIVSPHRFKRCDLSQEPKLDFFLGTSRLFGRESWGLVLAAAMGLPVKSLEPLGIRGDYGFPSPLSPPVSRLSTRERKK